MEQLFTVGNSKAVASLTVNLNKDDYYSIISVIESAYNAGIDAGREQHAAEFRSLLSLEPNH